MAAGGVESKRHRRGRVVDNMDDQSQGSIMNMRAAFEERTGKTKRREERYDRKRAKNGRRGGGGGGGWGGGGGGK
jgi:hypothetical protein